MSIAVRLPDSLVNDAKEHGKIHHRSVPKQIEYWSKIGRIAEENPDLPISFIKDIILGLHDVKKGNTSPYEFD